MKGRRRLMFLGVTGSFLSASIILLDAFLVDQPVHAIESAPGRTMKGLNEAWDSEERRQELMTELARQCASARSIRDQAVALAEKNRSMHLNHYKQAVAITQQAEALLAKSCL